MLICRSFSVTSCMLFSAEALQRHECVGLLVYTSFRPAQFTPITSNLHVSLVSPDYIS